MLPLETFNLVVQSTPLISIDFIVRDESGKVLVGKRNNRPAKNYWFVPGGRVLKDEALYCAFKRLTFAELGLELSSASRFLGVYQHFYEDSFADDKSSTHYVVLAYEIIVERKNLVLPNVQHNEYRWDDENILLTREDVHIHTKWYFDIGKQADFGGIL